MNKKVIIINVPLYNQNDKAPYGKVEITEIEQYQNEGWQLERITPVIPGQTSTTIVSIIQYVVQFTK